MRLIFVIIVFLFLISIVRLVYRKGKIQDIHFDGSSSVALKGILSISIIFYHLIGYIDDKPIIFDEFGQWGCQVVSVFFFIMGYGLTKNYQSRGREYLDSFLIHRFKKLMPPYIFCIILYAIFRYCTIDGFNFIQGCMENLPDCVDFILPTSWFVVASLVFYTVFYLVFRNCRSFNLCILLLVVWNIVYYWLLSSANFGVQWTKSIFAINVGMIYACYENRLNDIVSRHPYGSILIPLFIYVVLYRGALLFQLIPNVTLPLYYHISCCNILPLFVVYSICLLGGFHSKIFHYLGRFSYEIYLVQGCLCCIFVNYSSCPFLYIGIVTFLSILFGWCVHETFSVVHRLINNRLKS